MNTIGYLRGLINESPLQQIDISPSYQLLELLKKNKKNAIYGVHNHHLLYEKLLTTKPLNNDMLIIDGADGQCLHVIGSLAIWMERYQSGEKLPKLILIGNSDFKLPDYATFLHQYHTRMYDRQIIIDTVNNWTDVLSKSFDELQKEDSVVILVVPREEDFENYIQKVDIFLPEEIEITIWPTIPPDNGKKQLFIVHGEIDSLLWINKVEVVVDLGLEANKYITSMGNEEEVICYSDRNRIDRREEWLGYDRFGKYFCMYELENMPKQNPLPANRRSIYWLVSQLSQVLNNYRDHVKLITNERLDSAEKVLSYFNFDAFLIENIYYPPLAIKLIQTRLERSKPLSSAILVSCLIGSPLNTISWSKIPQQTFSDSSPLQNYFDLIKNFLISGDSPSYINQKILNYLTDCYNKTHQILSLDPPDPNELFLDDDMLDDIRGTFSHKHLHRDISVQYRDRHNNSWIVDRSLTSMPELPRDINAISWIITSGPDTIAYLWI